MQNHTSRPTSCVVWVLVTTTGTSYIFIWEMPLLLDTTGQSQMSVLNSKVYDLYDVCCYLLKEGLNPLFTFLFPFVFRMLRHFHPITPVKRTFMGSVLQDTELGMPFHILWPLKSHDHELYFLKEFCLFTAWAAWCQLKKQMFNIPFILSFQNMVPCRE